MTTDVQMTQVAQGVVESAKPWVEQVLAWAQAGAVAAANEAPQIVTEILYRQGIVASILMFLGTVLTVASVFLLRAGIKSYKADSYSDAHVGFIASSVGCVVIGLPLLFVNLYNLLSVIYTPRLVLLEYLSGLLK